MPHRSAGLALLLLLAAGLASIYGAQRPAAPSEMRTVLEEHQDLSPEAWAEEVLGRLSLAQKVGQMIMPRTLGGFSPAGSESFEETAALIDGLEVGGLIVSLGTPLDVAAKLNVLQRRSALPLLVAADLETGAGFRFRGAVHLPTGMDLGGASDFPSLMALGAVGSPSLAYEMGRITALEALALGIQVPFAPVLDVNNNPENPVINTRSFGEDPELVGALGSCLVRGIQDHGAFAVGKHFPGHGDTDTDSHLALPVIRIDRERMDEVELPPFRRAIEAGMRGVMTAHIALPALTGSAELPATLSPSVLTGLLRGDLGFDGLLFTDALNMEAIDRLYSRGEAATRAVEAGADVLLMPPEPEAAVRAVVDAVRSGRIAESRIDDSVRRILRLKAEAGLHLERTVDLESVHARVGIEPHLAVVEEIAERSLTLIRNERNLLPLLGTRTARVLSVAYRTPSALRAGRSFDGTLRETYPRLRTEAIGPETTPEEYDRLSREARGMDLVVVSLYIPRAALAGDEAGPPELMEFVRGVARSGRPHTVISFGSPYFLREFPEVQSYLLAWSPAEASQRAAADALLGRIPIRGRTPTALPPDFPVGYGIRLPDTAGGTASLGDCA